MTTEPEDLSHISRTYYEAKLNKALQIINNHKKIYKFLIISCYLAIAICLTVYITYFFKKSQNIKIINDIKKNPNVLKVEKAMTNPRIRIQHDDENIYEIRAKKATHNADQEVSLEEVFAEGKIGKISAGELRVEDGGDHLIFSKNPVLILNQTEK